MKKEKCRPKKYLESLPGQKVRIKLAAFVKLIANEGRLYDEQKFRIVDRKEKIYEFKPRSHRFFNFFYAGGKIIITNGYAIKNRKSSTRKL